MAMSDVTRILSQIEIHRAAAEAARELYIGTTIDADIRRAG